MPDLSAQVRARFDANRHHVLATLRADGAPRLSGTEVRFDGRCVSLGMMPHSRKLADVRRDPRVEIHSAPLEDDLGAGDAKLAGCLHTLAPDEIANGEAEPAGTFFALAIQLVSVVRVDRDELVLDVWRPGRERHTIRRR